MALLMIPGYMLDAELWLEVEPALAHYGPIVHADLAQDNSITAMARRAIASAPSEFILIGFSMGGYVAREIARQVPERVKGLILIATSARGDSDIQVNRRAPVTHQNAPEAFKGLSRAAINSSLHPNNADRDDLISSIQAMNLRIGYAAFERQSLLVRHDERGELGTIKCPCLIIAGEQDRLRSRAEAIELHQGLAKSTFAVIEGAGHMVPLEAPRLLTKTILDWLSKLSH
ncbi:alpha/beta fold hydrolase [Rhizobium oryzicola]|uniref:Alpha/beta hydrolase n=1 Tax=Rhizobium oryzicola TaxID=1232668 RepID=A0ABT8T5W8_9HYPH|nr:alpha/beta hydrolase [Rhizobium oryzicola]MDO1585413.1 alpha/beta hydrolase [Rhizobium oryzicola]